MSKYHSNPARIPLFSTTDHADITQISHPVHKKQHPDTNKHPEITPNASKTSNKSHIIQIPSQVHINKI